MRPARNSYDVVVIGGGHNGLVAAAYLARAGRSVLVLERLDHTGGAAVSHRPFPGVDARLSRYSYLVSLLPRRIVDDLGLRFRVRPRRISSYTPVGEGGLLVDTTAPERTRASFRRLTGSDRDFQAWQHFSATTGRLAERVFATMTEPLPTRAELRRLIDDEPTWEAIFERPLGETITATFADDTVRGVVFTDALIGTFSHGDDPTLRQNRCFLYHVVGGGTGDWNVPVGGMGALTDALADAARAAGAELVTGAAVTGIDSDGRAAEVSYDGGTVGARHVLVNAAPRELDRLLGRPARDDPEGSQLKVNMVLRRLPRLRDPQVDPRDAFAGTFHVAESYRQLEDAYRQANAGILPEVLPSELYCHTLTDRSILSGEAAASGMHTLTLFGLHTPARLFRDDPRTARTAALDAALRGLEAVLGEPLADCLATDADGRPCLEVRSPVDLERELGLPGGHIFHGDLQFPWCTEESDGPAERWGVATDVANVLICGAGAVRGGGVSGLGGHNAAMAVLSG